MDERDKLEKSLKNEKEMLDIIPKKISSYFAEFTSSRLSIIKHKDGTHLAT